MLLCLLALVGTLGTTNLVRRQAAQSLEEAVQYWMEHPYLEPGERLKNMLTGGAGQQEEALREFVRQFGKKPPSSRTELRKEQAHLDGLVEGAFSMLKKVPAYRFGLVPAHPDALSYLTYMFMHGGWMHLLGNLFILFLTGPFLEDAWGRPLFAAVYLVSGIFSALMFAVHYPHLEGPLIGASGAIAGVMGAFLIRFWHRRIRFFYWFFFVFYGTFEAPAWLMLGIWLLRELAFAQAMDTVAPGTGGGGTAHWAHVWGFGFGAIVAIAMKRFDIEERFIHPAIEAKITVVNNEPIERAMDTFKAGDAEEALRLLEAELRREPGNIDAELALWNLSVQSGRAGEAVGHAKSLIRSYLRSGNEDGAVGVWSELVGHAPGERVEPAAAVSVARLLAAAGRKEEAGFALEALTMAPVEEVPAGPLVRGARLAVEEGLPMGRLIVSRLKEHPDVPEETRLELERAAERIPAAPEPVAPQSEDVLAEPESEEAMSGQLVGGPVEHTLQVREAVPLALEGDTIRLRIGENERKLRLDHLKAVASAAVPGVSGKPTVVVDLMLDGPWEDRPVLRTVRFLGASFDPRAVVPGENPVESLREMLSQIISWSGATGLPDPESARGRPFQRFGSMAEYEEEVLGVSPS